MTLEDYIDNPMGGSVLSHRKMYKDMYEDKFKKLNLRETYSFNLYYDETMDTYYAHIKVPSEVVPRFKYDILFKFVAPNQALKGTSNLKKYSCRFFSNDPAFTFTFAYTFYKRNLIVEEFKSRLPRKSLTSPPNEKNPNQQLGYVKAIYFAYLFMNKAGLFETHKYKNKYVRSKILTDIRNASDIISERQSLGAKILKAQKKEGEAKKKIEREIKTKAQRTSAKTSKKTRTSNKAPKTKKTKKR